MKLLSFVAFFGKIWEIVIEALSRVFYIRARASQSSSGRLRQSSGENASKMSSISLNEIKAQKMRYFRHFSQSQSPGNRYRGVGIMRRSCLAILSALVFFIAIFISSGHHRGKTQVG